MMIQRTFKIRGFTMYRLKIEDVTQEDIKFTRNNAEGYAFGKDTPKANDLQIKEIVVLNDTIAMYKNMIHDLDIQKKNLVKQVKVV
jgi:hypothetical protein